MPVLALCWFSFNFRARSARTGRIARHGRRGDSRAPNRPGSPGRGLAFAYGWVAGRSRLISCPSSRRSRSMATGKSSTATAVTRNSPDG